MCRYKNRPAKLDNDRGMRAQTSFTSWIFRRSEITAGPFIGDRHVISGELAADHRSLNVIKPWLSTSHRPRSKDSHPLAFDSWIAFQKSMGIAPKL
jgi:hypothetical protein